MFLAEGPYTCTVGVFVVLRGDVNWADIKDSDELIQIHPVRLLRHCPEGDLNLSELFGQVLQMSLRVSHPLTYEAI